jgi:ferric-dicitrate binding protein FerR (iron transport regulator)
MKALVQALIPFLLFAGTTASAQNCSDWSATLFSLSGSVDLRRAGDDRWLPARFGDRLCIGDSVRAAPYARAALSLPDSVDISLDESTTVTVVRSEDDRRTWLDLLTGLINVISRDPRALRVTTPFANAGLEGTEFVVAVNATDTEVAVFEGEILLANAAGAVSIGPGQTSTAELGKISEPRALTDSRQLTRWAQYYPVIIAGELPAPDAEQPAAEPVEFLLRRAQQRLSLGRVEGAITDLAAALELDSGNAGARSLQALLEMANGDAAAGGRRIDEALRLDPAPGPSLRARALLEQSRSDCGAA